MKPSEAPPQNPSPDEESRLVARIQDGDPAALAEVRRWVRGAFGPYRSRLSEEMEDLEQEVVLELLQALSAGRFEGRSLLATYVRRMVHHKCLNRLRGRRGKQWVDVDIAGAELVDREPSPFDQARRRRELELGLRVLAAMSESCRELWAMIHREMGYEAMGERLGVAAGTLRVRVLRCREKALALRASLSAPGGNVPPAEGT